MQIDWAGKRDMCIPIATLMKWPKKWFTDIYRICVIKFRATLCLELVLSMECSNVYRPIIFV